MEEFDLVASHAVDGVAEAPRAATGRVAAWRRLGEVLVPPLVAFVAGWSLLAYRSPYRGLALFLTPSYGRWDTGDYLLLARYGYNAAWHCHGHSLPPHLPPGNYLCGTIGWFPGYPAAMRAVSVIPGVNLPVAGLIVSWVCWYVVLVLMWQLAAESRSTATRWMCLLIAAFFPGQVYFAAIFPISLCIAGILGALYFALRTSARSLAWAGFASGAIAAYSYLTAIVLAPALLVAALLALRGRRRLQAMIPAAGVLAGFGGVLLTMQIAVGIWDAYFISAEKYSVGVHSPLRTLVDRLEPLWSNVPASVYFRHTTAAQTLLAMGFVVLALVATIVHASRRIPSPLREPPADHRQGGIPATERVAAPARRSLASRWNAVVPGRVSAFDLTFALAAVGAWLVPYIAGGYASTYRSEAFVILTVPLLRRIPAWLLLVPLGASVVIAWHMAPYFFNGKLM